MSEIIICVECGYPNAIQTPHIVRISRCKICGKLLNGKLVLFLRALKLVPYVLIIYGSLLIFAAGFTYAIVLSATNSYAFPASAVYGFIKCYSLQIWVDILLYFKFLSTIHDCFQSYS